MLDSAAGVLKTVGKMGTNPLGVVITAAAVLTAEFIACGRAAEKLHHESDSLGVGTTFLQQMGRAANRLGIDAGEAIGKIPRFQENILEAGRSLEGRQAIGRLGLNADELLGKDTEEQLTTVAKGIMKLGSSAARTEIELKLFGRAGKELEPVLKEIAAGRISSAAGSRDFSVSELATQEAFWKKLKSLGSVLKEQFVTGPMHVATWLTREFGLGPSEEEATRQELERRRREEEGAKIQQRLEREKQLKPIADLQKDWQLQVRLNTVEAGGGTAKELEPRKELVKLQDSLLRQGVSELAVRERIAQAMARVTAQACELAAVEGQAQNAREARAAGLFENLPERAPASWRGFEDDWARQRQLAAGYDLRDRERAGHLTETDLAAGKRMAQGMMPDEAVARRPNRRGFASSWRGRRPCTRSTRKAAAWTNRWPPPAARWCWPTASSPPAARWPTCCERGGAGGQDRRGGPLPADLQRSGGQGRAPRPGPQRRLDPGQGAGSPGPGADREKGPRSGRRAARPHPPPGRGHGRPDRRPAGL